ncbi:hypothetical protein AWB79_01694 [Caballeronia hypogeia]|uniref:Uncharacterized protein n=1 Tax=Caballeronia hypogeia TaxID=1777140 RepID=A0A157ZZD6_9BURK|nr:hypothetical protein AWB79_01694 [Caballeronia hypogeia]
MLSFVLGFFREYWIVLVACMIMHFGFPWLDAWLDRRNDA